MAKNHPARSHCHKQEQTQVLTISSPDSFWTQLRCCMSRFVCTSRSALGVSAPAFRTHAPGLVQRNPVLQTAHGESSCGRQSLWGLNHKHHAEKQGLHKAINTAVIIQCTSSLSVTRRRLFSYVNVTKISLKPNTIALPSGSILCIHHWRWRLKRLLHWLVFRLDIWHVVGLLNTRQPKGMSNVGQTRDYLRLDMM